jgi:hypothetical protein
VRDGMNRFIFVAQSSVRNGPDGIVIRHEGLMQC